MSGGTSTLWRTSLCGVVMALTVFGTGCAVETASSSEEDTVEVQEDLAAIPTVELDRPQMPKGMLNVPHTLIVGPHTKSSVGHPTDRMEPEPDPWSPTGRGENSGYRDQTTASTPDKPDDHK